MSFRFRPKIPLFMSKEFSSVLRLGLGFLHPLIFSRGNSPSSNSYFVLSYHIFFLIHLQGIFPVLRIGFGFLQTQVIFSRGKFPISLLLSPPFCLSTSTSEIALLWSASHYFFQTNFSNSQRSIWPSPSCQDAFLSPTGVRRASSGQWPTYIAGWR